MVEGIEVARGNSTERKKNNSKNWRMIQMSFLQNGLSPDAGTDRLNHIPSE